VGINKLWGARRICLWSWEVGRDKCGVDDFIVEADELTSKGEGGERVEENILICVYRDNRRRGWDVTGEANE
jgi:hypothetical protein